MDKIDIKSLSLEELKKAIIDIGDKPFRAKQIYDWIHVKLITDFDDMTNISSSLREKLKDKFEIINAKVLEVLTSKTDDTSKYLIKLYDGNIIESVLMKYKHGNSVCISSQAGCKMGCKFCASTLLGLERNLLVSEMLEQIYVIQRLSGQRVSNVVVMGTGEPLDNYDNLVKFIKMISDENGLNISQRNLTVSTCGLVPQINLLAEENFQITLALSLHAPNDEIRKSLMPVANKYNIKETIESCVKYLEKTNRRLTFEYSLVEGINDSEEDADNLSKLLKGINCHVNLIPVNPIKERNYLQSKLKTIQNFKNKLEKNKINVTIRRELGQDIDAACGQLRKSYIETKI